jgi:hypothetical protein
MKTLFLYKHVFRIVATNIFFLCILVGTVASADPRQFPHSIQFIYIDSNIGNSSGGHTAFRLGNTVYHFQVFPDGLFRLVRDNWPYFRYIYNDLENRTLNLAHISVNSKTFERIQRRFNRYYLIQEAHMARLDALKADEKLLSDLVAGKNDILVKGVGLFSQDIEPSLSAPLRSAMAFTHGKDFLEKGIRDLDMELANISMDLTIPGTTIISNTTYPPRFVSISNTYQQNRLKRAALSVIQNVLPLDRDNLWDISTLTPTGDPSELNINERMLFKAYANQLITTVVELPVSKRPDWGYPLLLAVARYQAVHRSLDENHLILLDVFPTDARIVSDKSLGEDPVVMAKLVERSRKTYLDIRKKTVTKLALDERNYNLLEESGGRYAELEKGLRMKAVRMAYGRLIPSTPGLVNLPFEPDSRINIVPKLEYVQFAYKTYRQQLKNCYAYDLITKNCATEILCLINDTFDSQKEIRQALGGYIQPGDDFSYLPFQLYTLISRQFRINKTEVLPAYRKRMVARMYTTESNWAAVYLREFNTLSSSIYKHLPGDTPFLFFTDDVIWPRPLYGLANTVCGGLISAAGLLTLPVDQGALTKKGLRGLLFSFPELFFFNIRKGSFNYVSDSDDPQTKDLERSSPAFNRYVSP